MGKDDYDNLLKRNIAEKNAIFAEFFKDLKQQTNEAKELEKKYRKSVNSETSETSENSENSENEPPRKRRRTISGTINTNLYNLKLDFRKKYYTRSSSKNRSNENSNGGSTNQFEDVLSERKTGKRKLQVLFPWAKPFQRSIDLMKMGVCDVDEEQEDNSDDSFDDSSEERAPTKRRRGYKVYRSPYDSNSIPSVDEITEEMLNNVAERSSLKEYSKINGTSCHQCRQKTLDTKTVCRSGECIGVRGQFCGPCLRGRYGESAVEALKDPNWACPPCRGLCNCSICRTRSGLRPTGILAPVVLEEGYSSVMDYLRNAEHDDT